MSIKEQLIAAIQAINDDDDIEFLNKVMDAYAALHPLKHNPVTKVRYVPLSKIHANNYNPNSVATKEMKLLHTSIKNDGYTQPTVAFYDKSKDMYIIVDGFHRYSVDMRYKDIHDLNKGYLPIVVIEKDLADRMASTVRHNRARGKHSVEGMSNIVLNMLKEGKTDEQVCNELGLEVDELLKLKHITGFAKLFQNTDYNLAWETNKQIATRLKAEEE